MHMEELRNMKKDFREKAGDCIGRAKRMVERCETSGIAQMTEQVTADCVQKTLDTLTENA